MTYEKFRFNRFNIVKEHINPTIELANRIGELELVLIEQLKLIDKDRYYTVTGYKSLLGFCCRSLGLSQTQALRIITKVRRAEPTSNIGEIKSTLQDS